MDPAIVVGLTSVIGILLLVYLGMHVAIALALVSGLALLAHSGSLILPVRLAVLAATDGVSSYSFGVVPLFILMGILVGHADLGRDAFRVAHAAVGRIRGGLGIATVLANAVFAAITGISIASAAIFSRVAVPEMRRFGYSKQFATGVVAGSSILGMLMPPSVLLIVYAIVAQQSVAAMFRAAILPAILLATLFSVGILIMTRLTPGFVQPGFNPAAERGPKLGAWQSMSLSGPILLLIVMVMGGIYGGVFTPTEAGAAGATLALLIVIAKRRFSVAMLWASLVESGRLTASILFLIICATMYSRMLGVTGLPYMLTEWLREIEVGFVQLMILYCVLMILLGMILDSTSTMLILIPIFLPTALAFGADPVWFGIITVLGAEIGLLTPPLGISVFVVKDAIRDPDTTLGDIFRGAFPFAAMMALMLALLVMFPGLTRW
ncbi:TRAP transporter large permease [Frigidibacter sp.]|uniref:TRAP transporter large permease n=1 Tax=Frigidibacter sp. TaxID=2586418 RepID=UPI0027373783|nr:TRAP transporter large permease [Frigidibacter sp.]MDP3342217.1 TRAP transporter large permease [Frigidibacter sp.]